MTFLTICGNTTVWNSQRKNRCNKKKQYRQLGETTCCGRLRCRKTSKLLSFTLDFVEKNKAFALWDVDSCCWKDVGPSRQETTGWRLSLHPYHYYHCYHYYHYYHFLWAYFGNQVDLSKTGWLTFIWTHVRYEKCENSFFVTTTSDPWLLNTWIWSKVNIKILIRAALNHNIHCSWGLQSYSYEFAVQNKIVISSLAPWQTAGGCVCQELLIVWVCLCVCAGNMCEDWMGAVWMKQTVEEEMDGGNFILCPITGKEQERALNREEEEELRGEQHRGER